MERLGSKRRIKDSSTIASGSNLNGTDGFRTFVAPISPAATAISAPASHASSISRLLSSFAKNFTPSILNKSSWSAATPTTAKATSNGSTDRSDDAKRSDGSRHILKLDAYLNISSDEDEDEDRPIVSKSGSRKPALCQVLVANSTPTPHIFLGRQMPVVNAAPTPRIYAEDSKGKKRSRQSHPDDLEGLFTLKKPKLSFDMVDSNARTGSSADVTKRVMSESRSHRLGAKVAASSTFAYTASVPFPGKSFSVSDTPLSSRSSSRNSYWEPGPSPNIFSIPPRAGSSASAYGGAMMSSAQSRSRPSSVASNPPVLMSSRNRRYERTRAYNSDTKRILRDLERAAARVPSSGSRSFGSSDRVVVESSAAGFAGTQGSAKMCAALHAPDEAQSVSRLATLGSTILYRPFNAYSQWDRRGKSKVSGICPRSIVSSGPIYRFAKPYPVDAEKYDGKQKRHAEPSSLRFGNPHSTSSATKTADPTKTSVSADQSVTASQKAQISDFLVSKPLFEYSYPCGVMDESGVSSSDDGVDMFVNAADNLASKSELEATTESAKFVDELNEESVRFFTGNDQTKEATQERLEERLKFALADVEDETGDAMPNKWGSLDDLSAGLPASLIITNLPTSLFVGDEIRAEFESIFVAFDSLATFQYLRSFKRCRVNFTSSLKATLARLHCNELDFHGSLIRCFFAQMVEQRPDEEDNHLLKLPKLEKQFLISPPASPPVGWEQGREEEPIVNFDLISRLTAIAGEAGPHVVHPRNDSCPAIVVHTCDDDDDSPALKPKIPQTRRPDPVFN